ncbi:MAG: response regulator [Bacilli bacterium]|nr:response regulator [Bacilli bacterium]
MEKGLNNSYILIVDDNLMNREILSDILSSDYKVLLATDGDEAVEILEKHKEEILVVLLDLVMPKMDGFEVLNIANKNKWTRDIPFVMISSDVRLENIKRAYKLGVQDFIGRPFVEQAVKEKIVNVIKAFAKQQFLIESLYKSVIEREKNSSMLVYMLSQMVEYRNGESGDHVRHIGLITRILLNKLMELDKSYKFTEDEVEQIILASAFHDIGKIAVPSEILNKPGKLTPEEYNIMKTHTSIGYEMIDSLTEYKDEKLVKYVKDICRYHHEKWDGRGFPCGLKGDEIPIWAQIVSIADVYDALTSKRCYKDAYSHEKSMNMIFNNECGIFNPLLLKCLEACGDEIRFRYETDRGQGQESRVKERIMALFNNIEEGNNQ